MSVIQLGLQPLTTADSITAAGGVIRLVNDTANPGNNYYYGTNGSGTRGWYSLTSEGVNDIVGTANQVLANGTSGSAQTGSVTLTLASALASINSITSAAGQNLVLALGTGGTALTLASSTLAATFAGNITVNGAGTSTFAGQLHANNSSSQTALLVGNTSNAGSYIRFQNSGSSAEYIGTNSSGEVLIQTGSTTRATFNSTATTLAGNLTVSGTGTSTFAGDVALQRTTTVTLRLQNTDTGTTTSDGAFIQTVAGTNATNVGTFENAPLQFWTNGNNRGGFSAVGDFSVATGNLTVSGTGTSTFAGSVGVQSTSAPYGSGVGQIYVRDGGTPTKRLFMGYDTTLDGGYIVSEQTGVTNKSLYIQPGGGGTAIGGNLTVSGSTASTSTTTGALVVTGGVGIGGALYVGSSMSSASFSASGTGSGIYYQATIGANNGFVVSRWLTNSSAGDLWVGTEGAAGTLMTGTTANAGLMFTAVNKPIHFGVNSTIALTLASGGNATLAGNLTQSTTSGSNVFNAYTYIVDKELFIKRTGVQDWGIRAAVSGGALEFVDWNSTVTRLSLSVAGNAAFGNTPNAGIRIDTNSDPGTLTYDVSDVWIGIRAAPERAATTGIGYGIVAQPRVSSGTQSYAVSGSFEQPTGTVSNWIGVRIGGRSAISGNYAIYDSSGYSSYLSGNLTVSGTGTSTFAGSAKVGASGTADSRLHVYESTTAGTGNGLTIEQAGAGDAVTQYLLTGVQRWSTGIDNSDSDAFVISAGALGTNNVLRATTGGDVSLTGNLTVNGGVARFQDPTNSYAVTITNASAKTLIETQFGGSSLGVRVNGSGTDSLTVASTGVTVRDALTVSGSTASTSTTTGALVVTGGVGIGGAAYVGGNVSANGVAGNIGQATTSNRYFDVGSTTNGQTVGYNLGVFDGSNNYRSSLFLDDSTGVTGLNMAFSSGDVQFQIQRLATPLLTINSTTTSVAGNLTVSGTGHSTFSGRITSNHSTAEDNSLYAANTNSLGYGPYFRGGDGTRYVAHFTDKDANTVFLLRETGSELATDLLVSRDNPAGATVIAANNSSLTAGSTSKVSLATQAGTWEMVNNRTGGNLTFEYGTPKLTLDVGGNAAVAGNLTVSGTGTSTFSSSTASTSTTTGALVITGGLGVGGAGYFGGNLSATGTSATITVTATNMSSYFRARNSVTASSGMSIEAASLAGYVWNYENGVLYIGSNNTLALTIGTDGSATVAGNLTANRWTTTVATVTYSATTNIDFTNSGIQSISLTGNLTLTTSNRSSGRGAVIRLISDGSSRTLSFPSWVWIGGAAPTSIAANKTAIISLTCFGSNDTDIVAAYSVQA